MNSEIIKVKYIQCNRGGFHDGELLNIVCLNDQCKSSALCCCVCIDELHKGHKTTTLKKILIDSKEVGKEAQLQGKEQVKPSIQFNNDIISNLIQSSKKDAFQELKMKCHTVRSQLQKIEEGLTEYYKKIQSEIINQDQSNSSIKIFQAVQNIQGASSLTTMQLALKQLLISLEQVKKQKITKSNRKQLAQDSIINLISNSNQEVVNSTMNRLNEIQNQLKKGIELITKSTGNLKNLFNKEVFYFSSELKSKDIWVTDSYKVVSKKGQQYQIVLMQPGISFIDDVTAFRFKINKSTSKWIALGMCHKKISQKKNFVFDYKSIGHGCYMISSNAGSWSHISEQLNNKVKAFNFYEGDIISCIVNKSIGQIFFIKELKPGMQTSSKRQFYQLAYNNDPSDQLHPCVVFYFQNDEVEYLPAINLNSIPKYEYLFSNTEKHPKLKVIDNKIIRALEGNAEYRAVLLNKTLQENFQIPKKFSFKILKSTNNWIALGMCHSKTAANSNYGFDFKAPFHGYYMISANGGTWSTIDSTKNNLIRTFKFGQGDIIECEVIFGQNPTDPQNKIIFKKGIESYQLNFKGVAGDKLYPCAMLHYPNDQISILPTF